MRQGRKLTANVRTENEKENEEKGREKGFLKLKSPIKRILDLGFQGLLLFP